MISVLDAQKKVLEFCDVIGTEKVHFTKSLGRVLAQDVFARDPLPPFPASTKDGYGNKTFEKLTFVCKDFRNSIREFQHFSSYAVVSTDGAGVRPVVGDSNAGSRPDGKLQPGNCLLFSSKLY